MSFFIPHGTINSDYTQMYDGKIKAWINIPEEESKELAQFYFKNSTTSFEYLENGCHEDGVFKCVRCYRRHFLIDNFDFLCDGCVNLLTTSFPNHEATIAINNFKLTEDLKIERNKLRTFLFNVLNAEEIFYKDKQLIVVKELLKNDGMLIFSPIDTINDKKSHINLSVFDLTFD